MKLLDGSRFPRLVATGCTAVLVGALVGVVIGGAVGVSRPSTSTIAGTPTLPNNHSSSTPSNSVGAKSAGDSAAYRAPRQNIDARDFPAGACVAFDPTANGPGHGATVMLDPGHGGPDDGASGRTSAGKVILEKDSSLQIAEQAMRQLRNTGYRVALSRTVDTAVTRLSAADLSTSGFSDQGNRADLLARVRCANLSHAVALVSIHLDAYSDPQVGGSSTIYDAIRPFKGENLELAQTLQEHIVAALGRLHAVPNRGVFTDTGTGGGNVTKSGTKYGHLMLLGPAKHGHIEHPTVMPGALVEPLFLSNTEEADLVSTLLVQRQLGGAIARAVDTFLRGR